MKLLLNSKPFSCLSCLCKPSAYAVIPQLLGPLTALLSIIPQILAFVGVALLTALVFARDTVKMFFYKCRDFATAHKVTAALFSVVILVGFVSGTYLLIETARNWTTLTPEANVQKRQCWQYTALADHGQPSEAGKTEQDI